MKVFTNDIGQEIRPGDDVVVVTVSTGRVNARVGVFLGWSEGGSLQCRVTDNSYTWTDTRTGAAGRFSDIPAEFRKYAKADRLVITTLQRNRIYRVA